MNKGKEIMLLHHSFIENVKKDPKKIAVIDQSTEKNVSYDDLLIASLVFKDVFSRYKSRYLGIMLPPSSGCVIAIMGAIFCQKVPVMINYSTGAMENCLYAQNKCNFRTIITSRKLFEKLGLEEFKGVVFMEDLVPEISLIQKLKAKLLSKLPMAQLKNLVGNGEMTDDLVVLFTSGSEKDPQAVQLSHKNIKHNITAVEDVLNINHKDVFVTNLPYFHVFGLTVNLWVPLVVGGQIITVLSPLDYKLVVESVAKYKVTVLVSTPTFLYGYLQKSKRGDFDSVRYFVSGADKLPVQIREEYIKVHNIEVMEGYGATETSPIIAVNYPSCFKRGSVGKPLPGVQVRITDLETGAELPRGTEGKILVKGDLVMKGYFGNIEETYVRIRDGWYDTGDMGVLDEEGFLHHRGRLKRFVKIGGEMVSLVKVEDEINKLLPEETICCVVDIPDQIKGAEIVAVVTTKQIDHKEIRKKLAKILPKIAIPKKFAIMDEMPMTSSGKVNFRAVEAKCRNEEMETF